MEKQKENEVEREEDREDMQFLKKKKRDRVLKNQTTLELEEQQRLARMTDKIEKRPVNTRFVLLKQSSTASIGGFGLDPSSFKGLQGAHSMVNLAKKGSKDRAEGINVSDLDETAFGGKDIRDELTALHYQNYNFSAKTLKRDNKNQADKEVQDVYQSKFQNLTVEESNDRSAVTSHYGGANSFREQPRPMTAQLQRKTTPAFMRRQESLAKRTKKKQDKDIDMKCRTIENKLQSAQMRRENNLNQIKMRLQFDQARKDHLGQQKIKDVEKTLKEEENP